MHQQIKKQQQAEYHPNERIFIQSRAEINLIIVEEYAEMMADGTVFVSLTPKFCSECKGMLPIDHCKTMLPIKYREQKVTNTVPSRYQIIQ